MEGIEVSEAHPAAQRDAGDERKVGHLFRWKRPMEVVSPTFGL